MQQSNGSLETSNQTQQPQENNSGSEQLGKPEKAPRNQRQQQQPQNKQPETKDEKPLSLAELFKRENPDDPEDTSFSVEDEDDPTKPVDSVDGLSKRLKIKPEEVYAIKVPMPNGAEPMTLGDLKDRVGELVDLDARELEFTQRRVRGEGEILRAQQELRSLMALIPKDKLTPELINKVRQNHETTQARERQLTLEHIPSWNDEQTRTADIQGMVSMLSDYGFDEGFIATVVDHRALKFLRDTYLMRKRIQKALSEVKIPPRKGNKAPSQKTGKPAQRPVDSQNTRTASKSSSARLMEFLNSKG
jgi:hypothetical protein